MTIREYKVQIRFGDGAWDDVTELTRDLDRARRSANNILTAECRAGDDVETRIVSREVTAWLPIGAPKRSTRAGAETIR
jgi:hypothetical protein